MGETLTLTAEDGHKFAAYRAQPSGAPRGGLVVVQEIFGVNQHIRKVADGFAAARSDLPKILGALRNAVGEDTVITGMNLYDPFLADFLTGSAGQAVAAQSVNLDVAFNSLLGASFGAFGIPVADVQTAFSTTDFTDTATLPGIGTVPLNVARICEWTWMCAPAPIGPNIHANPDGYQVIAVAFQQVIGRLG